MLGFSETKRCRVPVMTLNAVEPTAMNDVQISGGDFSPMASLFQKHRQRLSRGFATLSAVTSGASNAVTLSDANSFTHGWYFWGILGRTRATVHLY